MRCSLLLALVLATGCGDEPVRELTDWTLEVEGAAPVPVSLPAHLELPSRPVRYTLRSQVDLPWRCPCTLVVPSLPARARLLVDGAPAVALDASPSDRYRSAGWHAWRLPDSATGDRRVSLALVVEHSWELAGWLDLTPRLSPTARGDSSYLALVAFHRAAEIGSVAIILLVCLMSMVSFVLDRARVVYGWFALLAALVLVPVLFQFGRTQAVLGTVDIPIALFTLNAAWLVQLWFMHAQFSAPPPGRGWLVPGGLAAAAALLSINRFAAAPYTIIACAAVLWLPVTVYVLAFHLRRVRHREPRVRRMARVLLASWAIALTTTWLELAAPIGLGGLVVGLHPAPIGLALFAAVQSLTLAGERIRSQRESEELNSELAARMALLMERGRELARVGEDLGRQAETSDRDVTRAVAGLSAPATDGLEPGELVEARYRVIDRIGAGGMGAVYRVERLNDGARLALKLLPGAPTQRDLVRFAREAEITARLQDPNIVTIVDVDLTGGGVLYLVMELVDGTSLDRARDRFGNVAWAQSIIRQAARGLSVMHARGIVHRDLKPGNILLAGERAAPQVKIADFGIARSELMLESAPAEPLGAADLEGDLTRTGAVFGTPLYMAPELAAGVRAAPPSSDVFSLGVIAYEILTGVRPFAEAPVLARLLGRPLLPPSPLELGDLPAARAALVARCLAFDPEERPTAAEVSRTFADEER